MSSMVVPFNRVKRRRIKVKRLNSDAQVSIQYTHTQVYIQTTKPLISTTKYNKCTRVGLSSDRWIVSGTAVQWHFILISMEISDLRFLQFNNNNKKKISSLYYYYIVYIFIIHENIFLEWLIMGACRIYLIKSFKNGLMTLHVIPTSIVRYYFNKI